MDANQPPDLSLSTSTPAHQDGASGLPQAAHSPSTPSSNSSQATDETTGASMAPLADDNDDSAIDQEWVNKAKDIVEQTKGDPFTQSRELNKAKADYLKTRYNKDFKVAEDKVQ